MLKNIATSGQRISVSETNTLPRYIVFFSSEYLFVLCLLRRESRFGLARRGLNAQSDACQHHTAVILQNESESSKSIKLHTAAARPIGYILPRRKQVYVVVEHLFYVTFIDDRKPAYLPTKGGIVWPVSPVRLKPRPRHTCSSPNTRPITPAPPPPLMPSSKERWERACKRSIEEGATEGYWIRSSLGKSIKNGELPAILRAQCYRRFLWTVRRAIEC